MQPPTSALRPHTHRYASTDARKDVPMTESRVIIDLAVALAAAFAGGFIAQRLRLPVILGYLVGGVVISSSTPGYVANIDTVRVLADLGVALLMFSLGVEFSLAELNRVRRVAGVGALLQIAVTITFGAGIATILGWGWASSIVFGMVVTLSSSIVALKLLLPRGEASAPHGRVALGVSIVQDLALVPMLIVLPVFAGDGGNLLGRLAVSLSVAATVLAGVVVLGTRLAPRVLERVAATASRELFLLAVLAIALGTALTTEAAGLSLALGAFLAGLVLSESEFSHQALADVIPLRDAFATLFFVSIGMLLDITYVRAEYALVLGVVASIVVGKALILATIVRWLGLASAMAVLVGLLLAQMGELSFILASEASVRDVLAGERYNLIVAAIVGSILVDALLYGAAPRLAVWARRLDRGRDVPQFADAGALAELRRHCVVCGYGRLGQELVDALQRRGLRCVVIDIDPQAARRASERGAVALYGDAGNVEVLRHAGVERARALVVAVSDPAAAEAAIRHGRRAGTRLSIVARAGGREQLARLRALGADEVVQPEFEAGLETIRHVMRVYGVDDRQVGALVQGRRHAYYDAEPAEA